ncbi:TetR/AcrR family transcriptional regulator [Nocardia brasiliensis]
MTSRTSPGDQNPQPPRRRRRTQSGQVLSHQLIVRTCLRLIEFHGVEGVTMRKLGTSLGADATAIYRYFHNKDDLLLAVTDELIGAIVSQFKPSGDWTADLRQFAILMYRNNLANPQLSQLATTRVTGRTNEIQALETILGIMRGAGFDQTTAVRHLRSFIGLVLSHAALDARMTRINAEQHSADNTAWCEVYAKLPVARFPNIGASAPDLMQTMPRSSFPAILEFFLAALSTELTKRSATVQAPVAARARANPVSAKTNSVPRHRRE